MSSLQGRTAIVTGGGKGIGAGIARAAAAAGARVAVNYANGRDTAQAVVDQITAAGGQAVAVQADVAREDDVERLFAETRAAYGPVDLLVNNAGVWDFQVLQDVTVESFHRHYDTNVLSTVLTSRAFAAQDDIAGGAIINLTSAGIIQTGPATSLYTGTKMAVVGTTRVLAVELAPRGIRVNAIAAGLIDTDGTRASGFIGSEAADQYAATIPLRRIGTPDDIASVAVFLASEDARYITGDVIHATGGVV